MSTRRTFLLTSGKVIFSGIAGASLLSLGDSCAPTSLPTPVSTNPPPPPGPDGRIAVDVSDLSATNPAKVAAGLFGSDGMPVLITRMSDTDFRALSMLCTHASCQVQSQLSGNDIPCLCHGSKYGLDGSVVQGPSTQPLKTYDAKYDATNKQVRILLT